MPVHTLSSAEEFEEKGHAEVEFVGFRYVGDQSTKTDHDIRQRAGYNGPAKFQQGRVYFALLPTYLDPDNVENDGMGVHALEARNDFEVLYDPERLAEALLERNYLPPDVFYEGFDRWKRRKAMAKLGLEDEGRVFEKDDETPYRDQLRTIAGIEGDDEIVAVSQQRTDEYVSRFSRSDASAVVDVLRQDSDEIDLQSAGLTDMAEFLTRFTPETVEQAADAALGDGDLDDVVIERVDDQDASDEASASAVDETDAAADTDAGARDDSDDAEGDADAASEPPFDPSALTVSEVEERVADVDDTAALHALAEAERAGDKRKGVAEAIDSRLDELEA